MLFYKPLHIILIKRIVEFKSLRTQLAAAEASLTTSGKNRVTINVTNKGKGLLKK